MKNHRFAMSAIGMLAAAALMAGVAAAASSTAAKTYPTLTVVVR